MVPCAMTATTSTDLVESHNCWQNYAAPKLNQCKRGLLQRASLERIFSAAYNVCISPRRPASSCSWTNRVVLARYTTRDPPTGASR